MASTNNFPPDVPAGEDKAAEDTTAGALRAKAADLADKATETVKDGYYRTRDALAEIDPVEAAREGGQAVAGAVQRHPVVAFGLGALSVGLIAWTALRDRDDWSSRARRYEPDYGYWRRLFDDYRGEASKASDSALNMGEKWLRDYGPSARDYGSQMRGYAEDGGRLLARRAQKEPIAALIGVGIAVYALGALLNAGAASARDSGDRHRR